MFIPVSKPCIDESDVSAVAEVLRSGWLTTGPVVTNFERDLAAYTGANHAVALNSCTAGLFLALKALGIGPGDQVIVPCVTYVATAHVVGWCGAELVLCDVNPDTRNIDIVDLQRRITSRTKAVMPVHIAGHPCDMKSVWRIASEYGLNVIEDAAHALGARGEWGHVGTGQSDAIVYSFYATKNLPCGEGGMLVCSDDEMAEKVRKMSYFGISKRAHERYSSKGSWYYEVESLGYKFNMDSIHAALGLSQFKRFADRQAKRRQVAESYFEALSSVKGLELPVWHEGHAWHLFQVRVKNQQRDAMVQKLTEASIGTSVHFIPLYRHPYYAKSFDAADFPGSEEVFPESLSLPMHGGVEVAKIACMLD